MSFNALISLLQMFIVNECHRRFYILFVSTGNTCNMQFISYGSIIILLSLYFPLLLNMICMIASLEEGNIKFKTRTSVEPKPYIPYN